jgi:hypothetical protein
VKVYTYRYNGSRLAHRHPETEETMFAIMNDPGVDEDKFEIYELVPVHIKTTTVVTRTLVRK